jgi:hypothetical protein
MQTRRYTQLPGMTLAVLLTLLVGQGLVFGHDDGDRTAPRTLEGTWNVTLRFPVCDPPTTVPFCSCPGGTPNIPISGLHMYLKHGSFLEVPGGSLFRGPGLGSWERLGHNQFEARFKFFLFNTDGSRGGNEEVTNHIHLTGHDAFEATATFDLFDATGNRLSPEEGCTINETATRFE